VITIILSKFDDGTVGNFVLHSSLKSGKTKHVLLDILGKDFSSEIKAACSAIHDDGECFSTITSHAEVYGARDGEPLFRVKTYVLVDDAILALFPDKDRLCSQILLIED
jgi:hypothetical protein